MVTEDNKLTGGKPGPIEYEEMKRILSEYTVFRKIYEKNIGKEKYFGNAENNDDPRLSEGGSHQLVFKMFRLRRFVLSLGAQKEKLFLFYHYIHGESVERCAELMDISRRTAYRLKKRAVAYAAARYPVYLEKEKSAKIF